MATHGFILGAKKDYIKYRFTRCAELLGGEAMKPSQNKHCKVINYKEIKPIDLLMQFMIILIL